MMPQPELTPSNQLLQPETIAHLFEAQHFVCNAPRIDKLPSDATRVTTFSYYPDFTVQRRQLFSGIAMPDAKPTVISEHDGLNGLRTFLQETITDMREHYEVTDLTQQIETVLTRTSFIGERELNEAARGIAVRWKAYLHDDPRHQLAVPAGIIHTADQAIQKSSEYLFDRVMQQFSPAEQTAYTNRIVRDLHELQKNPDTTKIILLDDWTLSQVQLNTGASSIHFHPRVTGRHHKHIEVNLVAASPQQLASPIQLQLIEAPVYAYFRTDESPDGTPYVTGSHSSVDFGFEDIIRDAVTVRNQLHPDIPVFMPPLTNIRRDYGEYRHTYRTPLVQRAKIFGRRIVAGMLPR